MNTLPGIEEDPLDGWCGDATSVVEFLRPLREQLDAPGVLEVCVNRPGELQVETVNGWQVVNAPAMTQERCLSLATALATYCDQQINQERPLLSATLANARPLLNLFFSQLVSLNTQHLPEQDPSLRFQCLLVNDEFTAMGRVGAIAHSAAFLAGYNLRLLTVVQAMSQLDAVYGDKEARTFATNHGLQILYAPREQRDADEYSAMLGHFTERATSRGRSRSFSGHGHSTVSRNESEQRRALLLPQEFKELGRERLVVIFENCKPILGEKIRYHRDKVFQARLRPAPAVPRMNMDLHQAKVQQRWCYADDDLPPETQTLDREALAHDIQLAPEVLNGPPGKAADTLLDRFEQSKAVQDGGGSIEPADEDAADESTTTPTLPAREGGPQMEITGERQ